MATNSDIASAFVGAAVGDALGGPQEQSDRLPLFGSHPSGEPCFRSWLRFDRTTGLWDKVGAGEYSDDTQLLLCVARSILSGPNWLEYLTRQELPLWVAYQRGGGSSTISAARSWLDGFPPWESPFVDVRMRYFGAGGNGAAMRILPHCMTCQKNDFSSISRRIMLNCLSTHGHPRALLGSLVYAYLFMNAMQGRLISLPELPEAIAFADHSWVELDADHDGLREREQMMQSHGLDSIQCVWDTAKVEMMELVRNLKNVPAASPGDHLAAIGATGKATKGLGTVAALASLLLTNRFCLEPMNGLVAAAFAVGADTDTIASMTAALLAVNSTLRWTTPFEQSLQDHRYIKRIGQRLCVGELGEASAVLHRLDVRSLDLFGQKLQSSKFGTRITLPDGRTGSITKHVSFREASMRVLPCWYLRLDDGQSIYFRKPLGALSHNEH